MWVGWGAGRTRIRRGDDGGARLPSTIRSARLWVPRQRRREQRPQLVVLRTTDALIGREGSHGEVDRLGVLLDEIVAELSRFPEFETQRTVDVLGIDLRVVGHGDDHLEHLAGEEATNAAAPHAFGRGDRGGRPVFGRDPGEHRFEWEPLVLQISGRHLGVGDSFDIEERLVMHCWPPGSPSRARRS